MLIFKIMNKNKTLKILSFVCCIFSCVGCTNYDSLSQDIIVTDIENVSIQENKCLYTVRFYNRDIHRHTSTMSFYGKRGEYSYGDTLTLVKLNEK